MKNLCREEMPSYRDYLIDKNFIPLSYIPSTELKEYIKQTQNNDECLLKSPSIALEKLLSFRYKQGKEGKEDVIKYAIQFVEEKDWENLRRNITYWTRISDEEI